MHFKPFQFIALFLALCLAPALSRAETTGTQGIDFTPIAQARIDNTGGMPRLMINDEPVPPIIFWFNVGQVPNAVERFQDPQVKLAAAAGIHIYGLLIYFPRAADGINIDFATAEATLDTFIRADPKAVFFLRVVPYPTPQWGDWKDVSEDDKMIFDDGTTTPLQISIASDYFERSFREETARIVSHFEQSPYAGRMLGYHMGGPEFEMFAPHYTEKGPEYSPANHRKFREWLRGKYPSDAKLAAAWGDPALTLETANIPRPEKDRFPMRGTDDGLPIRVFYDRPGEQAWIDYSQYYSELVASRVIDWAKTVKEASGGRRLNMFCEGYLFEIGGSFSGHYALDKVLDAPEIDMLMSPISYARRQLGEPAGFMCPVDSISTRGKLWLNEDDMRTAFIDTTAIRKGLLSDIAFDRMAKDLHDTQGMLDRNLAAVIMHRSGIWWCDLVGAGTFNHPALWEMLRERLALYQEIYDNPRPYRPEVAVLIDEASRFTIRSDWDMSAWSLGALRNECDVSGAAIGYYLLQDFIDGATPPCKVVIFANAFALNDKQIAGIRKRLRADKPTAIWNYAPGYFAPEGTDAARIEKLTDIDVEVSTGTAGSNGLGLLAGEHLGGIFPEANQPMNFSPRFAVVDPQAEPLGRYAADGVVSAAQKTLDGVRNIYMADVGLYASALRKLFESAGVHVWTADRSVVAVDDSLLAIHSAVTGLKPIALPAGVTATPLNCKIEKQEGNTLHVDSIIGDTHWFRLERKEK